METKMENGNWVYRLNNLWLRLSPIGHLLKNLNTQLNCVISYRFQTPLRGIAVSPPPLLKNSFQLRVGLASMV